MLYAQQQAYSAYIAIANAEYIPIACSQTKLHQNKGKRKKARPQRQGKRRPGKFQRETKYLPPIASIATATEPG